MTWNYYYIPPKKIHWQGRADSPQASAFFQIIQLLNLNEPLSSHENNHSFALLGFSCDEGIKRNGGRVGAATGPHAIREALAKLPIHKKNIVCFDAGDINCTDCDLERSQEALGSVIALLLERGITPIVLGGGHELAWGQYLGIEKKFPHDRLGIVNFDAHFDMRPLLIKEKGSSGTPFLQIAKAHQSTDRRLDYNCIGIQKVSNIHPLFETAKTYHANVILADDLHVGRVEECVNLIDRVIHENQIIYVSLCLDVLASAYAPGVSAPQPLGLTPWQIIPFLRRLAASQKVVSYDIAELSPPFDTDHRTTKLAANFIYDIIHQHHFIL